MKPELSAVCVACDDTGVDVGPCEVCGGDGRLPWGATCSRCKGSGETVYPCRECGTLEEEDDCNASRPPYR